MTRTNVTSLQRRLTEWTQHPAQERNYQRGPLQMIDQALADPRRTTQLSIAAWLLGTWHLACGETAILNGDAAGWDEARLGCSFQRSALRLRCRPRGRSRRDDASDLPVLQAANSICVSLALGDPDAEELFAAFAALPDGAFDEATPYPLFVRELLALRAGQRPTVTPRLGPYSDVFLLWEGDLAVLARRLPDLLDLHLDQTRGSPGVPAPFDEPSVWLYPAEMLAIRAVRRELELPWPKVEHPLLFTNLVTMPVAGAWPTDSLLQRIEARLGST